MYTDPHGYSFIDGDDSQSYFAHISKVKNAQELQPGQMVSFDPEKKKKACAQSVHMAFKIQHDFH